MTESKYLEFSIQWHYPSRKTEVYNVRSKNQGSTLGQIKWYAPWRQYCFYPSPNCVFNVGCLEDIRVFILDVMAKRKMAKMRLDKNELGAKL